MPDIPDHHVIVKFGKGIPYDVQCKAMMDLEKNVRALCDVRAEVFADRRNDDSRLRAAMTPEQRAKL